MNYKNVFWVILLCCGAVFVQAQTAVFVSSSAANDNGNGLSWATAKKTIAAGITVAGGNGTVYVMAGEYVISAQLVIPTGVSVKGGYSFNSSGTDTSKRALPGTNNRWENATLCTIITGSGSHRIATVNGLLEGCVVRRGYNATQGGGALIDGGTVRYCVIRECDAYNESTLSAEGGGAYILNGGTLTNSVITECRADKGPAVSGGNGSLINNTITRNWPTHCGTVADYDGNVYSTVVIGQQCWTKQNLRTTHYNDGTPIPIGNSNSATEPRYYSNYMLTPTMLVNYGYLYNWLAVMGGAPSSNDNPSGVTGICPPGWHVPSGAEWSQMTNFVNSIMHYRCDGYISQITKSLASKSGWNTSTTSCQVGNTPSTNNTTLFAAYPAGLFDTLYSNFASGAYFWTSTENNSSNARRFSITATGTFVGSAYVDKSYSFSVRCVKQLSNSAPIVHTNTISNLNIQSTQAVCGGTCVDAGSPITAYGVCWSTSPNPTIDDSHTTDGSGMAAFTSIITGLTNGVTYYVRAYAINSYGVSYGEERVFTTDDCGDPNNLTDYDGNTYNSVRIGTQCWMKENLRTTHYADGTSIPLVMSAGTYSSYAYRYYPNNDSNTVNDYGYLYNWTAVMNGATSSETNPSGVQGICPTGWHVPSNTEWNQLCNTLRNQSEYLCNNNTSNIAKAVASPTGWGTSTTECAVGNMPDANNVAGFGAMPAGYMNASFSNFGYYARFWTTKISSSSATAYYLYNTSADIFYTTYSRSYAASVRCIRDN